MLFTKLCKENITILDQVTIYSYYEIENQLRYSAPFGNAQLGNFLYHLAENIVCDVLENVN